MKIYSLIFIFCFTMVAQTFAKPQVEHFQLNKDISTWEKYKNSKYDYEILYPERLELRLTGSWWKRDGRTFIITYGDVAALHGLSVTLYPGKTISEIAKALSIPEVQKLGEDPIEHTSKYHIIKWSKVKINDNVAIKAESFFKSSDDLFAITVILDGVTFSHLLWGDFDEVIAKKIISSFCFYK